MSGFLIDLRHALRSLLDSPALSIVAAATLALSIGLNSAVFAVVDGVVLRPLPFEHADRLIALCEHDRTERTDWCAASVPDVVDIAERSRTLEVVGVARSWPFLMRTTEGGEGVRGGLATPEAFRALGVSAAAGRLIEADDLGSSWRRVVVLSHEIWTSRFGSRRDVLGQSITLDGEPHTIVGILPPGVRVPRLEDVTMWRPIHFHPRDEERRDWRGFLAFGRRRADVSLAQVQGEVAALAEGIQREHFPAKDGWTIDVRTWHDVVVGSVRRTMYIFAGAVMFVLLIGCANVANLLLARASVRQRELAIRAALGASRAQLVRRLLAESLVLTLAGAAAGLLLAVWASRVFVSLAPQGIPRIDQVGLLGGGNGVRVLLFTVAVTALTTLLVGIAPALRGTRLDLHPTLAEGGGRSGTGRRTSRLGGALIVGEVALAVILVAGAGLLIRSFTTLVRWEPGFEQDHLLTTWTFTSPDKFESRRELAGYLAQAEAELRAIPSVIAVGAGSAGPLFGGDGEMGVVIDGRPAPADGPRQVALWYDVSPGYFGALGLPIVRGRNIAESDVDGAPLVAVVNETFARRYLAGMEPLGRTVHMVEHDATFTVVGVVRDVPPVRPGAEVPAQIFWSNRQVPRPATYFLVRTAGDPAGVAAAVRARLRSIDPETQISRMQTLRDWLGRELVRPRFAAVLIGTFGALALLLAAIGTYGLLAYTVTQQTKEFGIRMALGANRRAIVGRVLRRGLRLAALGAAVGLLGALALTRLLEGLLAGVGATDPATYVGSVAVLLAAATLACAIPAWRASRVDPMVSLRAD